MKEERESPHLLEEEKDDEERGEDEDKVTTVPSFVFVFPRGWSLPLVLLPS